MKTNMSESHDNPTDAQETDHAERKAMGSEPDRVAIASSQAAVLRLLAKVILESHNEPVDPA